MKRCYRIRENSRFQQIRRKGDSTADPLIVLCKLSNDLPYSRFGFSVSKRIGNAVVRNRVKRRMRESIRLQMAQIQPGWDIVLIARNPIRNAEYDQIDAACARLLRRASLFRQSAFQNPDSKADGPTKRAKAEHKVEKK